jgi:hypothetical protein
MDLQEIVWEDVDCMHMAQDRDQGRALVNTEMNIRVPHTIGNFLTISFTRNSMEFYCTINNEKINLHDVHSLANVVSHSLAAIPFPA